ncbi:MAG: acyloxyacyl hydrolase [Leeuwenhoekiella sp.]
MFNKQFLLLIFLAAFSLQAQDTKPFTLDFNYYYGSILEHNKDISSLITDHPDGFILGYSRRTFGHDDWSARYNYPDYGFSMVYEDFKNPYLGENIGVYGHFNFYLLKRRLMARIGQGVAVASNPYDVDDNFRNLAFGSRLLSSTYLMFNFKQPRIIDRFGLQMGLSVVHFSNANVKAPNVSTNTLTVNVGVNYEFDEGQLPAYKPKDTTSYSEPIHGNFVLRGGINESDFIGLGQYPFFVFSAFADKRISHKSTLQVGADFFLAYFLKEQIRYESIAFGNQFNVTGDEDWKRLGVFVGHELRFNKNALLTQAGYYAYYDYKFEGRVYFRVGLKRYFSKHIFGAVTLKSHGAKAEAVEFGIGYRL